VAIACERIFSILGVQRAPFDLFLGLPESCWTSYHSRLVLFGQSLHFAGGSFEGVWLSSIAHTLYSAPTVGWILGSIPVLTCHSVRAVVRYSSNGEYSLSEY
jgi:hypothetical protein